MLQKPVDFGFFVPNSHLLVVIGFLPVSFDRSGAFYLRAAISLSFSFSFLSWPDRHRQQNIFNYNDRTLHAVRPSVLLILILFIASAFERQHVFFCLLGAGLSDGPDDVRGGSVR